MEWNQPSFSNKQTLDHLKNLCSLAAVKSPDQLQSILEIITAIDKFENQSNVTPANAGGIPIFKVRLNHKVDFVTAKTYLEKEFELSVS